MAAPWMPSLKTKMNTGSRMALDVTVNSVRPIAVFGFPDERMTLFRPKYRCVTALPMAMTVMYCRAKGRVASVAPKKRRIGSIHISVTKVKTRPVMMFRVTSLERTLFATA